MKLYKKSIAIFAASILTVPFFTPSVVSAAQKSSETESSVSSPNTSDDLSGVTEQEPALTKSASVALPKTAMNETQINNLVDSLSKEYPNLSREYLLEGVHKQLNGDYSIGAVTSSEASNGTALMSVWQGITVDQMGATIDTALGIALSAGTGGLAAAIGNVGKHAAESALRTVVVKFLGSEGLKQGIDYALALTSPGKYIAEQWDNNDAYPSNGIINF